MSVWWQRETNDRMAVVVNPPYSDWNLIRLNMYTFANSKSAMNCFCFAWSCDTGESLSDDSRIMRDCELMDSPNRNDEAVSSVKLKSSGCSWRTEVQPLLSTGPSASISVREPFSVSSRSLMFSRMNCGRNNALECCQNAPSLEKMEFPSRG